MDSSDASRIIILLILAGTGISILTVENGLLGKSNQAVEINKKQNAEEKLDIALLEYRISKNTDKNVDIYNFLNKIEGLQEIKKENDKYRLVIDNISFFVDNDGNVASIKKIEENDSLIGKLFKIYESGIYNIEVQDEKYDIHLYYYNSSQEWSTDMVFGDSNDVAKSKTDKVCNMVVVKIDGDLKINSGVTVSPYYKTYGGPKGLFIIVSGKLECYGTIKNVVGCNAEGQNVYLWKNNNNTYEYVPKYGSGGGTKVSFTGNNWQSANGKSGYNAKLRGTGGGGSGAVNSCYSNGNSGSGANGTSYSGGAGRRRLYN